MYVSTKNISITTYQFYSEFYKYQHSFKRNMTTNFFSWYNIMLPIYKRFLWGKLYQELGLESLRQRQWNRKLRYFFKLTKNNSPKYLFNIIPTVRSTYRTRNIDNIPKFNVRHTFFRNSYFLSIATEWNNLDKSIRILQASLSLRKIY